MPKANELPSKEELERLLRYDPRTGQLFWRRRDKEMFEVPVGGRTAEHACNQWNSRFADKEALTKVNIGYRCGRIGYQYVLAHRVIWKMMTGEEPNEIDHIDGNRGNNKWQNLRSVTTSINRRNKNGSLDRENAIRRGNPWSSHGRNSPATRPPTPRNENPGVYWDRGRNKWMAQITRNLKTYNLGRFATKEEAIAARKAAEAKSRSEGGGS